MATRTASGAKDREGRMLLGQHLLELRKRLFLSALAILVTTVGGAFVTDYVLDAIRAPIAVIAHADDNRTVLNFTGITSAFDVRFQIAITVGIIVASPIWLYQILAFLVPGLTGKERKYTFGFLFSAIPLFLAGCAVGWFVFPHVVQLLNTFVPTDFVNVIDTKDYLGFVLKLVLAVGVAFVMPVFLVLLNFLRILSAKAIIHGWRVALIVIVLFCAIATPAADIIDMVLLAIPMAALYFLAAGVAWWHDRAVARREAELAREYGDPATA